MKIPTQIWIFCVGIFLQHYTFLQKRTFCILCEKFFHFVRKATNGLRQGNLGLGAKLKKRGGQMMNFFKNGWHFINNHFTGVTLNIGFIGLNFNRLPA